MMRTCRPLRCLDVAWGKGPPSRHHPVANRWQPETCSLPAPWMPNKRFVEVRFRVAKDRPWAVDIFERSQIFHPISHSTTTTFTKRRGR
jgi:hypothetical protein